jgi:hypothetical protein
VCFVIPDCCYLVRLLATGLTRHSGLLSVIFLLSLIWLTTPSIVMLDEIVAINNAFECLSMTDFDNAFADKKNIKL